MFTTLISATLISVFAIRGALADFAINNPDFTQCGQAAITWQPTTPPYSIVVVSPDDPCNDILIDFGEHTVTHITVNMTLPAGTSLIVNALDGNDEAAWSANLVVGPGDNSCLSGAAAAPAAASQSVTTSTSTSTSASASIPLVLGTSTTSKATTETIPGFAPLASTSTPAVPVGAANAGSLPAGSGALSNVRVSAPVTLLAGLAAVFATFAI